MCVCVYHVRLFLHHKGISNSVPCLLLVILTAI